jgi:hypothetical protein
MEDDADPVEAMLAATGDNGGGDDHLDDDPLEAFMNSLDASAEIVPQMSVNDLPSANALDHSHDNLNPYGSNLGHTLTISLEDLMQSTKASSDEGWESDAREEFDEDEETLERDRLEFMKAIRSLHGGAPAEQGGDDEDTADADADLVSPVEGTEERDSKGSEEQAVDATTKKSSEPQLGRMWNDEGDVMEEHEREVGYWRLVKSPPR